MIRQILTWCALCVFVGILLCPSSVHANTWQPGFRTMGIWEPKQNLRLDVAVWYPAKRLPNRLEYGSVSFIASRNAKPANGRFPLIILMHGSGETRFSWHILGGLLARSGFVVIAPTFTGDNANDMYHIMSMEQLTSKEREVNMLLAWLKKHSELAKSIDMSRIGIFGSGSGADAALLLAGGRLDATGWSKYCEEALTLRKSMNFADILDPYCVPWAKAHMDAFAKSLPPLDVARTNKVLPVRALALALPVYGMFVSKASLKDVNCPVLVTTQAEAMVFLSGLHAEAVIQALPKVPESYALTSEDTSLFEGEHTYFFSELIGKTKHEGIATLSTGDYPVVQRVITFFVNQMY